MVFPDSCSLLGACHRSRPSIVHVLYETDITIHSMQDMAGQVIIVKKAMHAKASIFFGNSHYAADALDA